VIISCEKCSTSYLVPDSAVSEAGRIVKCAKCNHKWLAMKKQTLGESAEAAAKATEGGPVPDYSFPKRSSLPVVIDYKMPISLKLAPAFLLMMIISTLGIFYNEELGNHFPSLKQFYDGKDIYSTEGMIFDGITFKKSEGDNGLNVTFGGNIINNSDQVMRIPQLKITLRNKYNDKIQSQIFSPNDRALGPGESYDLNKGYNITTITNLPESSEYVSLDCGNSLELRFRN
jgi:predicted Zn finger-like uncharacterized protein